VVHCDDLGLRCTAQSEKGAKALLKYTGKKKSFFRDNFFQNVFDDPVIKKTHNVF
jgi:hypothetical protein